MSAPQKRARVLDRQDADTATRLAALGLVVVAGGGILGLAVRAFVWAAGFGG